MATLARPLPLHRFERRLAPYLAVIYLALSALVLSEWAHALLTMTPGAPEQASQAEPW